MQLEGLTTLVRVLLFGMAGASLAAVSVFAVRLRSKHRGFWEAQRAGAGIWAEPTYLRLLSGPVMSGLRDQVLDRAGQTARVCGSATIILFILDTVLSLL